MTRLNQQVYDEPLPRGVAMGLKSRKVWAFSGLLAAVLLTSQGAPQATPSAKRPAADGPPVIVEVGDKARLQALILVTLQLELTCGPLDSYDPNSGNSNVNLWQAAGNSVAFDGLALPPFRDYVCDGAPHTYAVPLVPQTAFPGPPFHGGQAVAFANITICGEVGNEFVCSTGSDGPRVIDLVTTPGR